MDPTLYVLLLPQVLPDADYEGAQGARGQEEPTQQEHESHQSEVQSFMEQHAPDTEEVKGRRRRPRLANQYLLQSVDHALSWGVGLSLAYFQALKPPQPSQLNQKRSFLDVGASPPPAVHYPAEDPPGRRRACVRNQVDGARWIELPRRPLPQAASTGQPSTLVLTRARLDGLGGFCFWSDAGSGAPCGPARGTGPPTTSKELWWLLAFGWCCWSASVSGRWRLRLTMMLPTGASWRRLAGIS